MCGIAGIFKLDCCLKAQAVKTMLAQIKHRGPDDEGYLASDLDKHVYDLHGSDSKTSKGIHVDEFREEVKLVLGHRRLSIIDLSSDGHQPMCYGSTYIVFNGEIYNYIELRSELTGKGYTFTTKTDTEVILAAYQHWGFDCTKHLNGDWAFCIYDRMKNSLFLSRDRIGVKPLYYYHDSEHFAFASEIKSLLTLPFVQKKFDRESLLHFSAFSLRDHSERTMFESVKQVEPSFNLVVDLAQNKKTYFGYWSPVLVDEFGRYNQNKAESYADDIRDLLIDAVKVRLRADVRIGSCLSGGLDSSSIVVIANRLLGQQNGRYIQQLGEIQKTFTASFPGDKVDEYKYVCTIREHAGVDNIAVLPDLNVMLDELRTVLFHQDEPFGGGSVLAQWLVMKEASKHVKVILDGQGGDELFGGYPYHSAAFMSNALKDSRFGLLAREFLSMSLSGGKRARLRATLKTLPIFIAPEYWKMKIYLFKKRNLLSKGDMDCLPTEFICAFESDYAKASLAYLVKNNLPNLLHHEDRSSMAFSIEARVPYTDYRLMERILSIPSCYSQRNGWNKWLLRLAMRDLLPKEILWRKDKVGFSVPKGYSNQINKKAILNIWTKMFGFGESEAESLQLCEKY